VISAFYTHFVSAQLVPDFKVNDDTTNTEQYSAKIGVDSLGNFTAVWSDKRNGRSNVFCQRLDSDAVFLGTNFRININPDSSLLPSIAVSKGGNFAVSWLDVNNTGFIVSKVKCRIYSADGVALTDELLINDTVGSVTVGPSIAVNNSNEFIITWEQKNILFQKIDSLGNKIGINTKVNDDNGNNTHRNPVISVRPDKSFIITWNDTRPPASDNADDIYMQMYDRFGNKIGINERVNDDTSPFNLQQTPKISSDTLGNFVISWTDNRNDNDYTEIYTQMYINTGVKNGNNYRVTQSSIFYSKGVCNVVKRPNGEFLVAWGEFRQSIPLPYFQRFNNSGIRIGNDFLVTSEYPSVNKYYSDVTIFGNRIISLWTDARNGPFDVYCNIRSFTNPDTMVNIIQTSTIFPEKFSLIQNYPNPFNSSTIFRFKIKESDNYKFEIYNSLGQKVNEVFNKLLNPGSYKINYSSGLLASGVYYCILSSQKKKQAKVFVILK
jgi:hypothetical protein